MTPKRQAGVPLPLGAHPRGTGINFAVFSRHATAFSLLLFDSQQDRKPVAVLALDRRLNRTGDVWHLWVDGIGPGTLYAWRVDGPYAPGRGDRFNRHRLLLDPYATALAGTNCWDFARVCSDDELHADDDAAVKPRCLVPDDRFDWEGDRPPGIPWSDTVIYETHVRGLTIHPSSAVRHPGTFPGVVEKISYLPATGRNGRRIAAGTGVP